MEKLTKSVVTQDGQRHVVEDKNVVKSFESLGRESLGEGFQADSYIDALAKAVATTSIGNFGSMNTLLLENLDATMTSVLFNKRHLKIYNSLPRVPSAQTLFQWNRQTAYGSGRGALGFNEGGSPAVFTPSFQRSNATVKFYGVRRGYTHQMVQVGNMGGSFLDPVAEENRSGTLDLLEKLERWIMFGDSNWLDVSNANVHYDGILKQMNTNYPNHVYDLAGAPLTFENLENYAEELVTTGYLVDFSNLRLFANPRVISDLAKLNLQGQAFWMNSTNMPQGWRPGTPVNGYASQHGVIPFEESVFMDAVPFGRVNSISTGAGSYSVYGDPLSPITPASGSITLSAVTPPTGVTSNLPAGTYYYFVSAVNANGESAVLTGTNALGSVAVTAGQAVQISVTTGSPTATAYRIYRGTSSNALDSSVGLIGTNYPTMAGGTLTTGSLTAVNMNTPANSWLDFNQQIPGTSNMMLLNLSAEDMVIAQLAPLIKFPLALVSTTVEFFLLLYHVLAIKAPERQIWVKNIGQRA